VPGTMCPQVDPDRDPHEESAKGAIGIVLHRTPTDLAALENMAGDAHPVASEEHEQGREQPALAGPSARSACV